MITWESSMRNVGQVVVDVFRCEGFDASWDLLAEPIDTPFRD